MSNFEEWFNNDDFFKDRSRSYRLSRFVPVSVAWNYQQKKIEQLESDSEKLKERIIGMCGHPDAAQACRNIIKLLKEIEGE